MKKLVFGFGLAVSVCGTSAARAEHYDVFILAGQSNMDGRGKVEELTGELAHWKEPQGDVRIAYSDSTLHHAALSSKGWEALMPGFGVPPPAFSNHKKITALPGPTFGPEVGFGRTMADGWKGHHVAILKFAEGGTSLEKDWQVGEKGKLYDQMMGFVERSLGELKKGGDTFEVRGFVWHQGESDAQLSAAQYEALLGNLITHVRGDVKGSMGKSGGELPVVIGEVFDNHERDSILAAERAACGKIPACALAPATGLKTEDAGTHFDAASQLELGKRMAEGMLKMVSASNVP